MDERLIKVKFISYFLISLFLYITALYVIQPNYSFQVFDLLVLTTLFYLFVFFHLWRKERQIYQKLTQQLVDKTNQPVELVVCPSCKVLQRYGSTSCASCKKEWILCGTCDIPFKEGESVLISTCCGYGFHPEHFETAIRELGHCPSCNSVEVLNEYNW